MSAGNVETAAAFYRYFDAAPFVECLYDRVADTVHRDLREELGFVAVFDRDLETEREIVDRHDRRASLFMRLRMQNGGRLAGRKHRVFSELEEVEIAAQVSLRQAAA